MIRQMISQTIKRFLSIALLCIALLASACSKTEQRSTNSAVSPPSAAPSAGADFEGLIAMKVETENQGRMEMTYFLKDRHTRIETKVPDVPEGEAVMLWDLEGGKITTIMPARKMYMVMDMKAAAEGMKDVKRTHGQEDEEFPKLTQTGRQETIAGYTCEHWLMGEKQDLDMCVAKGLGYFGMGGQSAGGLGSWKNLVFSPKMLAEAGSHPEWVKFLEGGAFPLKFTSSQDGKVMMTMEATRIEKKTLEDSLFAVPAGYKEMSIPNMRGVPAGKQ